MLADFQNSFKVNLLEIGNKAIIEYPITPQMRSYA